MTKPSALCFRTKGLDMASCLLRQNFRGPFRESNVSRFLAAAMVVDKVIVNWSAVRAELMVTSPGSWVQLVD
jgi:hypothetical protein